MHNFKYIFAQNTRPQGHKTVKISTTESFYKSETETKTEIIWWSQNDYFIYSTKYTLKPPVCVAVSYPFLLRVGILKMTAGLGCSQCGQCQTGRCQCKCEGGSHSIPHICQMDHSRWSASSVFWGRSKERSAPSELCKSHSCEF